MGLNVLEISSNMTKYYCHEKKTRATGIFEVSDSEYKTNLAAEQAKISERDSAIAALKLAVQDLEVKLESVLLNFLRKLIFLDLEQRRKSTASRRSATL